MLAGAVLALVRRFAEHELRLSDVDGLPVWLMKGGSPIAESDLLPYPSNSDVIAKPSVSAIMQSTIIQKIGLIAGYILVYHRLPSSRIAAPTEPSLLLFALTDVRQSRA